MPRKTTAVLTLLALCSPPVLADTAFTCLDPGAVEFNVTTKDEIMERYPFGSQAGTLTVNDAMIDHVTFTQTSVRKSLALEKKVTPARAQTFFFRDGLLVGYDFVSSFEEDHTDFDHSKIGEIVKGESTRDDVRALLGEPCGQQVPPMVDPGSASAFLYGYSQVKGSFKLSVYQKVLIVQFDADGVVSNISFQTSGER